MDVFTVVSLNSTNFAIDAINFCKWLNKQVRPKNTQRNRSSGIILSVLNTMPPERNSGSNTSNFAFVTQGKAV